jgi:hypothetical protein
MNRKRILKITVGLCMLVGLTGMAVPFFASMSPSEKVYAELPRINISDLKIGRYKIVKHPAAATWGRSGIGYSILVYRLQSSEIKAWSVPSKNGAVLMPDLHWWRPMYPCENFGISAAGSNSYNELSIQCNDSDTPEWWADKWKWSIDGKNYSRQVDDMEPLIGTEENGYFVIGKRS